jgi:hypothetical protein
MTTQDNKGSVRITEPFPYLGAYTLDELDQFLAEITEYEHKRAQEQQEPEWSKVKNDEQA